MTSAQLRLICIGLALPPLHAARFVVELATDLADALSRLDDTASAALLLDGDAAAPSADELEAAVERACLVVVVREPDAEHATAWLHRGADDVLGRDELDGPAAMRRIRFALARRLHLQRRLPAFSTDPGTGLPHRQQLVEHLSQLLALREREPSPMAVLVLRLEGPTPSIDAGEPAAANALQVLRRKIAVRLRAGVRASDVVASIDAGIFAVLLGSILAPGDAERVAEKLLAALMAPLAVGGVSYRVAVAAGIARYPQDGKDAERLLRRATALAAAAPTSDLSGPAAARDAPGEERTAANDDA